MNLQTVIFVGRSGAGKGVQSGLLQKFLNEKAPEIPIFYVETGQHFRAHVEKIGYTWDRARVVNQSGGRQPDFLAVWVWAHLFVEKFKGNEHIIFDGTPRSFGEAKMLHTAFPFYERTKPTVFFLNISRETAEARLRGRGRPDDLNPDAVARRLSWYENDVVPAIEFYRNEPSYNFVEIDGEQAPEKVHQDIVKLLAK